MKSNDIYDGITDIRDDLIAGANAEPKKRKRQIKQLWFSAVAAVLVFAVVGGIMFRSGGRVELHTAAIAQAVYPEMVQYPSDPSDYAAIDAWYSSKAAQRRDLGDVSDLQSFFSRSSAAFLTDTEEKNKVYSPLNVYMALSMLAQVTDGQSREQILTLLGSDSMEDLRKRVNDVWNANYRDDGALTSILANSLWLNENLEFKQDAMDILAEDFYASSYRGKMGSGEFNQALQDWLNEQTGGLLQEQAGNVKMDRNTILALASTVYYTGKWNNDFWKEATASQTFHTPTGDREIDFMHQSEWDLYFWGDHFTSVRQRFETGGYMWFLLPEKGVTPEELLNDAEAQEFLFTNDKYKNDWPKMHSLTINKSIPKFDVSSQFDLISGLMSLGVTDVFDSTVSDFTPMLEDESIPVRVSEVSHAARVLIDEDGSTAAAFTVIMMTEGAPTAPPEEEVDFVLDRPFLFCITGDSGLPLFVGVVNYPVE
ncbi:MAG: hypothetical protein J1E06_00090 [Acutalibacter sp.]|nr:hypothetical protein [Acutalibacter sp.]